ncbi:hypothetical protein PZX64_16395, partial [Klebsiella pneumoniae]|nr:hypothetical protein [Klebsiella pneumoniae]
DIAQNIHLSKDGHRKGRVSLFDRFTTRRSWSDSFRITQFDNAGKVVVDKLTDAL